MRRIVINPSGDEQKDLVQDMVIDLVLGTLGLAGLILSSAWVLRLLVGASLLEEINLLFILLGAATYVTMIRIHREIALPGEGTLWMTRRTFVGTILHGLNYGYCLFLMGIAFDIPTFRAIPRWIYDNLPEVLV